MPAQPEGTQGIRQFLAGFLKPNRWLPELQSTLPHSNDQWRRLLGRKAYRVLRLGETERPGSGKLLKEKRPGIYQCRGCGSELFDANTKFDSKTGWPSFYDPLAPENVTEFEDHSYGVLRREVRCARCGGHLGHVFHDAPQTPTGKRYCLNSTSLTFTPAIKSIKSCCL